MKLFVDQVNSFYICTYMIYYFTLNDGEDILPVAVQHHRYHSYKMMDQDSVCKLKKSIIVFKVNILNRLRE